MYLDIYAASAQLPPLAAKYMFWKRSPTSRIGIANFGSTLMTSLRSAASGPAARPNTRAEAIRMATITFLLIRASFLAEPRPSGKPGQDGPHLGIGQTSCQGRLVVLISAKSETWIWAGWPAVDRDTPRRGVSAPQCGGRAPRAETLRRHTTLRDVISSPGEPRSARVLRFGRFGVSQDLVFCGELAWCVGCRGFEI